MCYLAHVLSRNKVPNENDWHVCCSGSSIRSYTYNYCNSWNH